MHRNTHAGARIPRKCDARQPHCPHHNHEPSKSIGANSSGRQSTQINVESRRNLISIPFEATCPQINVELLFGATCPQITWNRVGSSFRRHVLSNRRVKSRRIALEATYSQIDVKSRRIALEATCSQIGVKSRRIALSKPHALKST